MADVRALLRQERASRQTASRPQRQSAAPAAAPTSRKRKATSDEGDERKRTRTEAATDVPAGFFDGRATTPGDDASPPPQPTHEQDAIQRTEATPPLQLPPSEKPLLPKLDAAGQAEMDAFLSEMTNEPMAQNGFSRYSTGVVIEAAPMTAAEIAAQAREEQSAQRARRDEEMEGEKEDAARQLEEEFDQMEGLEERLKKLREQREALRIARGQTKTESVDLPEPQVGDMESDSDDDEWDDWRFRAA